MVFRFAMTCLKHAGGYKRNGALLRIKINKPFWFTMAKLDNIILTLLLLLLQLTTTSYALYSYTFGLAITKCQLTCQDPQCQERCVKKYMTNEDILKRTQRCNTECEDEAEELRVICVQRCNYYLVDPNVYNLDKNPVTAETKTGKDGMLLANDYLRTRIRLLGPNGMPISGTVEEMGEEENSIKAVATTDKTTSQTSTTTNDADEYRVEIISQAAPHTPVASIYHQLIFAVLVRLVLLSS